MELNKEVFDDLKTKLDIVHLLLDKVMSEVQNLNARISPETDANTNNYEEGYKEWKMDFEAYSRRSERVDEVQEESFKHDVKGSYGK